MIVLGILLAVVVGLLRGGKLARLGDVSLKAMPLVWVALVMRALVGVVENAGFTYAPGLQIAAYILFFYAVWLNLAQPGIKLFGLGSLLNFVVIAANGGRMPVSADAIAAAGGSGTPTGTHVLLTEGTRLWFLADVIALPRISPVAQVISVGDILIVMGVFLFIQRRMVGEEEPAVLVSAKK
ncbi:DUF5317 domain-containing protein [Dethiobacter alkaliphilus]|uniref:DUF5317 domain-containing protein n=1 Tax=Dethiobacter alkaliphilus AHT 1 TaxID=555088 RepID=C0GF85_DETAL|nr:DUF5317 domain-containing protein [Dethiobacter alkaliphilus]EEG77845.1 conserved hypothetical protein [Dethiobacter alkaliphilus AHT 1]